MEMRLTDKEHELLLELMTEQHKHLLHEINKAHYRDYKAHLRDRCELLEGLLQRMQEAKSAA